MSEITRTAIVPLSLSETWELFNGNDLKDLVELSNAVVEVKDYRMREDGTPEYVMVNQAGPRQVSHRSDFTVFEPPHRAVDRVLESPLGGTFYADHEEVVGGTRVTHRWDVEPHGFMKLIWPLMKGFMQRNFQSDLDNIVERLQARSS